MSGPKIQEYNLIVGKIRGLEERMARGESGVNPLASFGITDQTLHICKVEAANSDDPQTYQVRVLAGASFKETEWLINYVLPADSTVTYSADDRVILLLNNSGVNYILSSANQQSALLTRHSHQGYYDGGWAGFYSGDI